MYFGALLAGASSSVDSPEHRVRTDRYTQPHREPASGFSTQSVTHDPNRFREAQMFVDYASP